MQSKRNRNIAVSVGICAAWVCIICILSALSNNDGNIIALAYVYARISGLLAGLGGLIFLVLRVFASISRTHNFGYAFFCTSNVLIGAAGVIFYFSRNINMVGLHELLPNLFIGVIMMADIFLYDYIFKGKD